MNWTPGKTRELLKALDEQGFRVEETTNGWRVLGHDPNGAKGIVSFHGDSSNWQAIRNTLSELQRIGFQDPNVWRREQRKYKPTVRAEEATGVLKGLAGAPVPAKEEPVVETAAPAVASSNGTGPACPECGKTMKNATGLGAHRYRSHGVVGKHRTAAPIVTPEPRTFDCQVCSKKFVSPEMLNEHMAGHGTEQLIDQVGAMIRAAFAAKDGTIKELRTKQARMEKALGKVVAEL